MMFNPLSLIRTALAGAFAAGTMSFCVLSVHADTLDLGGYPERLKGNGDQEPPRCQFDVPRAATEPFFVQWNCVDDVSDNSEIRTELWLLRNGAIAPQKVTDFLGFPASVQVTEGLLQAATVSAGLPAAFRLVARDKAGVATISPFVTVVAQDNSVDTCTLRLVTDNNGEEEIQILTVLATEARVSTQQTSSTDLRVLTPEQVLADPCEIDDVCSDDSEITFQAQVELENGTTAKGTLTVNPGDVFVTVTGTASIESSSLRSLELTGKTAIDGVVTTATLSCRQ